MPIDTEREVLELLLEQPRSPTEVADELEVSVQTASRNLKKLVEQGFAEEVRKSTGRGYKQYEVREFVRVFAGFGGELFDETLSLTDEKRAIVSVWKVPQPEFHPILLSYLLSPDTDRIDLDIKGIVVYGSVARGHAQSDSDIDLFILYGNDERTPEEKLSTTFSMSGTVVCPERKQIISEMWYTEREFFDGLSSGSQYLQNVLGEGIVLYDPEEVIRDARQGRAGKRVSA